MLVLATAASMSDRRDSLHALRMRVEPENQLIAQVASQIQFGLR